MKIFTLISPRTQILFEAFTTQKKDIHDALQASMCINTFWGKQ